MTEPVAAPPSPAEGPPPPPPPPALLPALARFERGDFRGATALARALLADADPEVQGAARDLLARMAPDPWALRLGLLALALLAIVAVVFR
jgi:hypothetical protein